MRETYLINKNGVKYIKDKNNSLIPNYITYEEGEYSYIYIEGKGFIGVNLGDDGIPNTKDDRNEFNAKYYSDNNLELYIDSNNPDNETLEIVNFQTLFGKDYYVILRPSLGFNFQIKNSKTLTLILSIIISIIIVSGLIILIYINKRKKNSLNRINEDNNSITQNLF